jgi:hypothetical protein
MPELRESSPSSSAPQNLEYMVIHMYTYVYINSYIHIFIYSYIHIYTHAPASRESCPSSSAPQDLARFPGKGASASVCVRLH